MEVLGVLIAAILTPLILAIVMIVSLLSPQQIITMQP